LRRLLNIVSLLNSGYKVSELGALSDKKLFSLLVQQQENADSKESQEFYVSQLIAAAMSYDEQHFDKIFSHCLLRFGFKDTYVQVIYPVLSRVGLMWASDTMPPAQEHFISNIIRQKLFTVIDSLPPPAITAETWVLFLPENEFHEIGLLFAHYLVKSSGRKSIYLGANMPMDSLKNTIKEIKPDKLLLFLVRNNFPEENQQFIDMLRSISPIKIIYLVGNENLIGSLKLGKIQWLQKVNELEHVLFPGN